MFHFRNGLDIKEREKKTRHTDAMLRQIYDDAIRRFMVGVGGGGATIEKELDLGSEISVILCDLSLFYPFLLQNGCELCEFSIVDKQCACEIFEYFHVISSRVSFHKHNMFRTQQ